MLIRKDLGENFIIIWQFIFY